MVSSLIITYLKEYFKDINAVTFYYAAFALLNLSINLKIKYLNKSLEGKNLMLVSLNSNQEKDLIE
jgi:hypothetical protein